MARFASDADVHLLPKSAESALELAVAILENGKRTSGDLRCFRPFSLLIVIDIGSIGDSNFKRQRDESIIKCFCKVLCGPRSQFRSSQQFSVKPLHLPV